MTTLRSHSLATLRAAAAQGQKLWRLDTGTDGEDDVLIGDERAEVIADILFYLDRDELPAHWTLEPISLEEIEERYGQGGQANG